MILSTKLKKLINIKRVFREPVLLFTASRYLGYAMVMVRGILLAKYLGPALFGTWGFLTLMEQYLSYSNFGLQYAVTVKLATQDAESRSARSKIISAAFLTSLLLTTLLAIAGVWVQIGHVELFTKYDINQYAILLVLWVSLVNLQHVLINIYRVYNELLRIAISELLTAFVPLVVVFLFRDESLITASLAAMAGSSLLSILIFLFKPPFEWTVKFSKDIVWGLFGVGVPLLIYNLSYNMITMVGRTILSAYYSKEEMGYYSFANSITSATLLGFRAILWLAFPMVLYRTRAEVNSQEAVKTVRKVNNLFNTSVFVSVFAVIIASPLLYMFLPQYRSAEKILAISIANPSHVIDLLGVEFNGNCPQETKSSRFDQYFSHCMCHPDWFMGFVAENASTVGGDCSSYWQFYLYFVTDLSGTTCNPTRGRLLEVFCHDTAFRKHHRCGCCIYWHHVGFYFLEHKSGFVDLHLRKPGKNPDALALCTKEVSLT